MLKLMLRLILLFPSLLLLLLSLLRFILRKYCLFCQQMGCDKDDDCDVESEQDVDMSFDYTEGKTLYRHPYLVQKLKK